MLKFVKEENDQGNTMLCRDMKRIGGDMIFKVFGNLLGNCYEYGLDIVNKEKKTVLYLAVENGHKDAVKIILENCPNNVAKPKGLSPVVIL